MFGGSVTLSADGATLAVGASRKDTNANTSNNGATYVSTRDDDIDIFGKTFDEMPALGQRRSTFEIKTREAFGITI